MDLESEAVAGRTEAGNADTAIFSPNAGAAEIVSALSRTVTLLFSVACGLAVANVYYAQPLLDTMADEFGINPATVGLVVTVTQIGYGLGLLLLVPLGDLLNQRRLIVGLSLLSVLALLTVAAAPNGTVLLAGMGAVGLLAVVTQVLVAYAAALAPAAERGRVVGVITAPYPARCRICSAGARSTSFQPQQRSSSQLCSPTFCPGSNIAAPPWPTRTLSSRYSRCSSRSRCCGFAGCSRS
jgi:hypothetical protein